MLKIYEQTIKKIYEENGKWMLDIEGLEKERGSK